MKKTIFTGLTVILILLFSISWCLQVNSRSGRSETDNNSLPIAFAYEELDMYFNPGSGVEGTVQYYIDYKPMQCDWKIIISIWI